MPAETLGLRRAMLALRPATMADVPFLSDVFAQTRADELAAVAWPAAAKAQFVASQFALQHRHFVTHFSRGDFLVVTRRGRPVGRLYIDRSPPTWRLIDIALAAPARGAGAGTALIRWLQRTARLAGADGIELQVLHANPAAARLYARLGFVEALSASPTHRRMTWSTRVS